MELRERSLANRGRCVRWAGIAAVAGGAMYAVKAGVILVGGGQPPVLFEAAPIAFGSSLFLLGKLLGGRLARAGRILAVAVTFATVANVVEETLFGREIVPAVSSVIDLLTGAGPFVALPLLGWSGRRQWSSLAPRDFGPLAVAGIYPLSVLVLLPIAFFVDLDGAAGERLIELPVLAIGAGWIALGWGLVTASRRDPGA